MVPMQDRQHRLSCVTMTKVVAFDIPMSNSERRDRFCITGNSILITIIKIRNCVQKVAQSNNYNKLARGTPYE